MTSAHHGDQQGAEDNLDGGIKPLAVGDPARIGPYLLLGRLGSGGMGRVYLARSEAGRTVAVKVVHAEHVADPQFRARFRREVEAARRVGERYTAPVLDAEPDAEFPWVATGYVPGLSLEQIVRGHGPLPAATVLTLADGLLRALADIHAAGIVHRDLKPSNVMVTVDGPKVIDFGIARAAETAVNSLTSSGMVIGTPGFMSPEQIRSGEVGPASDLFSLGCVLTYAATGHRPFAEGVGNHHAVMYQVLEEEPDLKGVDDPALHALITRLLAKPVAERPEIGALLEEEDAPPAGASWLPSEVIAHLARQSARLLDAEAAPVREEGERGTLPLGRAQKPPVPATPPAAPEGGEEPAKEAREKRRRRRLVVIPVIFVLAGGGGTMVALPLFSQDTDSGAHAAPPSATASVTPGTSASASSSPSPNGTASPKPRTKSPKADDGKAGGTDGSDGSDGRNGTDGRDAATTSGTGSSGGTTGSTSSSGGTTATGGTTSTGGSGSTGGSTTGGSTTGGSSGGSSGGGGGTVPSSFVGTWQNAEVYNGNQPATITISSTGAVRMTGLVSSPCPYVAKVTSTADNGKRINVSKPELDGPNPGYCWTTFSPSNFTLYSGGILYNVDAGSYHYKRG
ncbi:serine/threonine-protein kinase [Streptomyces sp. NPDC057682]|uniref:serine/threonine-protein kinase n=1 Tax=Streptomyces sp. NPDC057682 TaxID=3346210 RepID=UPI0036B3315C